MSSGVPDINSFYEIICHTCMYQAYINCKLHLLCEVIFMNFCTDLYKL